MGKTLAERLASADPQGVNAFLMQHGFASARDTSTLVHNINHFIQQADDNLLLQLMELHPDYDVFEEIALIRGGSHGGHQQHYKQHLPPQHQNNNHQQQGHHHADGFNNCTGCGGKCGGGMRNATGDGGGSVNWSEAFGRNAFYMTILAVSIVALVSLSRNPHNAKG